MFTDRKRYALLSLLDEVHQRPLVERALKSNKSTVKRYCDKLENEGLIKKRDNTNPIWYELTGAGRGQLEAMSTSFSDGGEDAQRILAEGESKRIWLLHHVTWKYPIHKDCPIHMNTEVAMKNWTKQLDEWKYCTVEKTTKHVIIHVKELRGFDPYEMKDRSRSICDRMIEIYEGNFGMEFGRAIQSGKPQFETNDPLCQQYAKHFTIKFNDGFSTVGLDASRLGGEFCFDNPKDAVEYIRMPKRVKIMEETVNRMDKKLDKEFSDLKETIHIIRNNEGVLADGMNLILNYMVKPNEKYVKESPEKRGVGYQ